MNLLSHISIETANRFYAIGWWVSLIGAAVTAASVALLLIGTWVRDRDFESRMVHSNQIAAEANERAGGLEAQAAQLKKEAADALLEQERLKAQLAWRVLSQDSLTTLVNGLLGRQGNAVIAFPSGDPEAQYFAIQLAKAFEAAKWVVQMQSRTYSNMLFFGLAIPGSDTAAIREVRAAFITAGVGFSNSNIPNAPFIATTGGPVSMGVPSISATIIVGSKPPPQP
jgi:hypothetical protein